MHPKWLGLLLVLAVLSSCESIAQALSSLDQSDGKTTAGPAQDSREQTAVPAARKEGAEPEETNPRWNRSTVDTAASVDYLTETERQVILEINKARTDPAEYCRRYLAPLRTLYHGRLLQYPGEVAISTSEGLAALEECIREMQAARPQAPLSPEKGLARAARDHAKDQARTGATGHVGSDGSSLDVRLSRYGRWDTSAGENIDYGNATAGRIVDSLLIDDGVSSRGHRRNLLNGSFRYIGVAAGPHKVYGFMCVMDFAGGYTSR